MFGWMGKILLVDLERGRISSELLEESLARDYIGGRGFNSLRLFQDLKPGTDPLAPENVICFAPGPLTGTPLSLTSRLEVSTLSPLSGILGDGNAGGAFATFLKRAGYDQIVISGRADRPCYLLIDDDQAALLDASHLWGQTTWQTTAALKKTHGSAFRVACIGQAGENLVRFSSVICDKYSSAARGSGAVMGSKNLKALAVRGTGRVDLADPESYQEMAAEDKKFFLTDPRMRDEIGAYGTHMGMLWWRPGYRYFETRFNADTLPRRLRPESWKAYELKRHACHGCVLHCKNRYKIPSGKRSGETGAGLEYETIFSLGTNCGILDPVTVLEMGNLADAYGMCSIPLGNVIAFAKNLYQRGIITAADTGGLSLAWDDSAAQLELIHHIALREGFGNILAEGMYGLAKIIGGEAMDSCYHVKGLCRGLHPAGIFALSHATATRGADHLRGRSWALRKDDSPVFMNLPEAHALFDSMDANPGKNMIIAERAATLADAAGRCKGAVTSWACAAPLSWRYPLFGGVARLLTAATGVDFSEDTISEAADRIYTLEMAFNTRQGLTRKDDRLPERPELRQTGEAKKEQEKHARMLAEYYRAHGCDPASGRPTAERLNRLGLGFAAQELAASEPYPAWQGPPYRPLDHYPHGGVRA